MITSITLGITLYILSKNALEFNEYIKALTLVTTSMCITIIGFIATIKFYKLNIEDSNE